MEEQDEKEKEQKKQGEFIATFQQLENLLGCGEKQRQTEETILSIMEMIEWKFPLRGLDIFSKSMTDYASARLSVKPSFDTFVHPAIGFPLIATCIAEVNAREAAKERERAATESNDFAPPQKTEMDTVTANLYLAQLSTKFAITEETDPVWFLWREAFAKAYKSGVLFDRISKQRCEQISYECQSQELERVKAASLTSPELREIARTWQAAINQGMTPESLKKAASIRTIKAILTEIKNQ